MCFISSSIDNQLQHQLIALHVSFLKGWEAADVYKVCVDGRVRAMIFLVTKQCETCPPLLHEI